MTLKRNVVSFMNMKGGVAKTILSANLANQLAEGMNKKVLFIDMDPQFNATQYLFSKYQKDYFDKSFKKAVPTVVDLFEAQDLSPKNIIDGTTDEIFQIDTVFSLSDNLKIIPGDLELIKFDFGDRGKEQELLNFLVDDNFKNAYDYIFIDSAPTYSFYTLATYIASDFYIMPIKPDHFSTLGVSLFERAFFGKDKQYRTKVEKLGLIYTIVEPNTIIAKDIMKHFNETDPGIPFKNYLKKTTSIPAGVNTGDMMTDLDSQIKKNIVDISKEFVERMDNYE